MFSASVNWRRLKKRMLISKDGSYLPIAENEIHKFRRQMECGNTRLAKRSLENAVRLYRLEFSLLKSAAKSGALGTHEFYGRALKWLAIGKRLFSDFLSDVNNKANIENCLADGRIALCVHRCYVQYAQIVLDFYGEDGICSTLDDSVKRDIISFIEHSLKLGVNFIISVLSTDGTPKFKNVAILHLKHRCRLIEYDAMLFRLVAGQDLWQEIRSFALNKTNSFPGWDKYLRCGFSEAILWSFLRAITKIRGRLEAIG